MIRDIKEVWQEAFDESIADPDSFNDGAAYADEKVQDYLADLVDAAMDRRKEEDI